MIKPNKIILIMSVIMLALAAAGCSKPELSKVSPIDSADHIAGNPAAPVQMIVYSDFECPFCEEFSQTMKQAEQEFTDKLTIAFRHYPLPGHGEAEKAAEASECAAEQGKFWGMHDKLFADNAAGRMSVDQFKKDAADLSLDTAKFNQCLDSGKFESKVKEQAAAGGRAGVTGTPTSFINGNIYPGAYPFADFTDSDGKPESGLKSIISGLLK